VWLRRYRSTCIASEKGETCEAKLILHESAPAAEWGEWQANDDDRRMWHKFTEKVPDDDPRWQEMRCVRCGVLFTDADGNKQLWAEHLHVGCPDGKLYTLRDAPPGAMWDMAWMRAHALDWATGPDGISLCVRLPNGWDWWVDQEASNCTMKQWKEWTEDGKQFRRWQGRSHYCWCRHGDPRSGTIHVDKNGNTCAAGAGSIAVPGYHGFLHNGYLTDG
jgi:hypothetical protein